MTSAESNRLTLARVLYVVAIMLAVIPLADALPLLWPLRPGVAEWRFGVVGMLSGALMTPLLGTFLVLAAAALLEHRRVLTVAAWLLFALVLVLVVVAVLFSLDFLEVRTRIQAQARPAALGAAAKAVWKMAVGGLVSLVMALGARRMALRLAPDSAAPEPEPEGLVHSTRR
jgi:hypothetical protein